MIGNRVDAGPNNNFSLARSAAGALIFDQHGNILLVEPTYKDYWDIPGGYIEQGETPTRACAREIMEELGITRKLDGPLVIDWAPHPNEGDKILFVFDGGSMTTRDADDINLAEGELASFEFLPIDEAVRRLIPRLSRRVAAAVNARAEGRTIYLEHGVPVV